MEPKVTGDITKKKKKSVYGHLHVPILPNSIIFVNHLVGDTK